VGQVAKLPKTRQIDNLPHVGMLHIYCDGPYTPDPLDAAYGMTQAEIEKLGRGKQHNGGEAIGQGPRQLPFFF
jgi:hypothetical protein